MVRVAEAVWERGISGGYDLPGRMPRSRATRMEVSLRGVFTRSGAVLEVETSAHEDTDYLIDANNPTGYAQVIEAWNSTPSLIRCHTIGLDLVTQWNTTCGLVYLLTDGHGSTRLVTDADGEVMQDVYNHQDQWFTYDAYGNLLETPEYRVTMFLYAGEQYHSATGLYYLRARYYDPSTGRFTALDPAAGSPQDPISLHKYLYANGNPVMYTDPSGLYTREFGYEAEDEIQKVYGRDHPGDEIVYGKWTRLPLLNLFQLKPDILNISKKRWLEIKPLSLSGLSEAEVAIAKYAPMLVFDYYPDAEWIPSTNTRVTKTGTRIWFANTGAIVFYTSSEVLSTELVVVTAIAMARQLLPLIVREVALTAGRLAGARIAVDTARLEQHFAIATILGLMVGFAI